MPTSLGDENDGIFAAPDLIVDQEDFDEVVNGWFAELELEAMMADRVNETAALVVAPMDEREEVLVRKATLSSIFGQRSQC